MEDPLEQSMQGGDEPSHGEVLCIVHSCLPRQTPTGKSEGHGHASYDGPSVESHWAHRFPICQIHLPELNDTAALPLSSREE